jgi:hypothetical protein
MFSKALCCTWGQMLRMLNLILHATSSNDIQVIKYYKNDMVAKYFCDMLAENIPGTCGPSFHSN